MKKKPQRVVKNAPAPFSRITVSFDDSAAFVRAFLFTADYQRALDVALGAGHPPTKLTQAQAWNEAKRLQRKRDAAERIASANQKRIAKAAERHAAIKKELDEKGKVDAVVLDSELTGRSGWHARQSIGSGRRARAKIFLSHVVTM